ncbi:hypothetical protein EGW08_010538 [Elysia chlorotica]|uniref:Carbohydrate sulfotransferase n=1 Tax=Elysia chlorotica TaxID=188477 RepID=A0A433TJG8_ELYCH|nr:hypothetical protein EGW08_010538 [Elysia chlorotica]
MSYFDNFPDPQIEMRDMQDVNCQVRSQGCELNQSAVATVEVDKLKVQGPSSDLHMQQRRETIARACASLPPETISRNMRHAMASRPHRFLYCPVEKSASTFWRRFMYQLVLTNPMQSPFDVSVQTVYSGKFPSNQVQVTESGKALDKMLRSFTKMLFIREPYSRLLSAYVDKLLAPNPILWSMWGLPSVALCRDPAGKPWCKDRSGYTRNPQTVFPAGDVEQPVTKAGQEEAATTPCGEDVTFPEFVKLAVTTLVNTNAHVMPIYRMCSPCYANYTVIGHMETFDSDVRFLLPKINVTESQVNLEKMDNNVAYDAIEDSVHDSMSTTWLKKSLRCITKLEVVRRIWRKLQIRGFISWRLKPSDFHLDELSVLHMDGPELIKVLLSANGKSSNRTELKLQKKQALKEAFSSLQPQQFTEILEKFGPDFTLFGFQQKPKAFEDFSRASFVNTGALDLTKDWNMDGFR